MFNSRKPNERINHIHEIALRIVYKDFNSLFQELLTEDNSLNIHRRNLQKPSKLKMAYHLSSRMMFLEFIEKPYSLKTTSHFRSRKIGTPKYGTEAPSYLGPKLWNLVPNEYKTI